MFQELLPDQGASGRSQGGRQLSVRALRFRIEDSEPMRRRGLDWSCYDPMVFAKANPSLLLMPPDASAGGRPLCSLKGEEKGYRRFVSSTARQPRR